MDWLTETRWSPYTVGIGIGVLSWFTFLLSNKPIGCSTAFARTSGMIEQAIRGEKVKLKSYYQQFAPAIDWEWMLVLGIVFGSLLSSILSGNFQWKLLPDSWVSAFGLTVYKRIIAAFVGGLFLGFGARWTGGCTSGHGISGTMQLTVSSWIAAIFFFVGGIFAAFLIFA